MHTITYELVQSFYFGGGLSPRLKFLGRLAANQRPRKRHTIAEPHRTDFDDKVSDRIGGLSGILPQRRNCIEHYTNWRFCGANKMQRVRDCFQIQNRGATGDQHKVGGFGSLQRSAVRMGGRVQVKDFTSCLLHPHCFMAEAARMGREHNG